MKKTLTTLAMGLFCIVGATTANAETLEGTIQTGVEYTVAFFGSATGSFTAPQTGYLKATFSSFQQNKFSEEGDIEWEPVEQLSSMDDPFYFTYAMLEGQTGYYNDSFNMEGEYTVEFSFEPNEEAAQYAPKDPEAPTITSLTPEEGSDLESLLGQTLTVVFEPAAGTSINGTPTFSIYADGVVDPEQAATAYTFQYMEYDDTNTYSKSYTEDYFENNSAYFVIGNTYTIIFDVPVMEGSTTKNVKVVKEAVWTGSWDPNADIDVEFISADPADGSTIYQEAQNITLTFSGPVNVSASKNEGGGASSPLTCAGVDGTGSDTLFSEWTIAIPKSALTGVGNMELMVSVTVTDENGNTMYFYDGTIMQEYLALTYPIFGAVTYQLGDITVQTPADGAPSETYSTDKENPTEVSSFQIVNVVPNNNNPIGPNISYLDIYNSIAVYNAAGGLVTTIDTTESGINEDDGKFYIVMKDEVTADGLYYLLIPETALDISADQGTTTYNNEATIWFQIGDEVEFPEAPAYTVNPANESTVEILQQVVVEWEGDVELSNLSTALITVTETATSGDNQFSQPMDFTAEISGSKLTIVPANSTFDGTVSISIAAGAVNMTVNDMLIGNEAIDLTYTVTPVEREEVAGIATKLTDSEGNVYGWSISFGEAELEFANLNQNLVAVKSLIEYPLEQGKEVTIVDGELIISLEGLAVGDYTLELPERYVLVGEDGYNGAMSLSITTTETEEPENPDPENPDPENPDDPNNPDNPDDPNNPGGDEPEGPSTGIAGIEADTNGLFHIYTINGVNVANGKAESVKNLNKGIYIINGKKVVVK